VGEVAVPAIVGLAEELARAHLRYDPFIASLLVVGGYDDAVPDLSPPARQAWRDRLVEVLVDCEQLEAGAEDLDRRVVLVAVRDHATRALATVDSRVQEFSVSTLPINGLFGPAVMPLVMTRASLVDPARAAAYLTRCRGLSTYLDQHAARLRAAASGLLPVAPLVQGGHQPAARGVGPSGPRPGAGAAATRPLGRGGGGGRSWSGSCARSCIRPWAAM
jgi:hypothetical protein